MKIIDHENHIVDVVDNDVAGEVAGRVVARQLCGDRLRMDGQQGGGNENGNVNMEGISEGLLGRHFGATPTAGR